MVNYITGYAVENINFVEVFGMPLQFIIMAVVGFLIALFINPLLLGLTTKIFKINNDYKKSFITIVIFYIVSIAFGGIVALIAYWGTNIPRISAISWILINGIFAFWLIKKRYELDLKKGFLVWLIWTVFSYVLGWIIGLILLIGGLIAFAFLK